MSRRLAMVPLIAILLLTALAAPARAQGLYVVVESTAAPGGTVPVALRADEEGKVVVRAWRLGAPQALLDAGIPLDRGERIGFLDPLATAPDAKERDLRAAAGLRPVLVGTPFMVPAGTPLAIDLPLPEEGLYLLAVSRGDVTAYATALVSDLGLVVKRGADRTIVWAVDRTTGEPLAGVQVSARLADASWATTETGADGVARFARPVPETAEIRASLGKSLAFGRLDAWAGGAADRRVHLSTHQPAYRPGERVEAKGIVRSVEDGRLRLEAGLSEVVLRLLGPDGKETASATVPLSADMGTFACSFDLPAEAPTGDWRLVAEVGGKTYEAPLVVDAYRKPAFEVTVTPAERRVFAGAKASFTVEAAWYEGGPLPDAPVSYQVLYHRVDQDLFPEDEIVRLFFGAEREAYRPEALATGTGRLDAGGRLVVPVDVPADRPDGFVSLTATVMGPDRVAVSGTGRIGLAVSPIAVDLETDRHLYGPEDVARVEVRVATADGSPAGSREGVLTVGLSPEAAGDAPPTETWIHTLPFATGPDGRAVLEAPLAGAGRYAFAVAVPRAKDEPPGPPAFARLHVWAIGERATPGAPGAGIEVVADRDVYAVGDVARLLVRPPAGLRAVLATLEGDALLSESVLRPSEATPTWSLEVTEDHVPNVFATFLAVDHGRVLRTSRVLRIPPRTRLLATSVLPDAAEILPGGESGLTVEVRDSAGAPASGAEVSVAVVDDALFALFADPAAPIEAFFHPPRRSGVATAEILDWVSVGWVATPTAKPGADLRDAEGMPVPAPSMAPPGAPPPPPSSPAMEPAADAAAPMEAEGGDDSRSGGVAGGLVPAERALEQKAKADGGSEAVTVREDFRTAVFWAPALRTDSTGRARVERVRYGDTLTRWRVSARSVDAATRVGSGTGFVRTKKNVSARLTLPRFLRAGDRVTVPLVLRNLTPGALPADWVIEAEGAGAPWQASGRADLAAGAAAAVEAEFASAGPADVPFTARVATTAGGDAERRVLPVLPRGIRKVEGRTVFARDGEAAVTLEIPAEAEPGTVSARAVVEPAYAQAMLAALPSLLEYPYGCTEQTLHRFLPLLSAAEVASALGLPARGRLEEAPKMLAAGLQRLAALQHPDGGFGWWESDRTDLGMTALVVRGLSRFLAADPESVNPESGRAKEMRDRAAEAVLRGISEDPPDLPTRASAFLALAVAGRLEASALPGADDGAWRSLPAAAQALLLEAALAVGRTDLVVPLRGLLDDRAKRGGDQVSWPATMEEPGPEGPSRWQDDDVETTAVVLHALLLAEAPPALLDAGARWLLLRRDEGEAWRSTRETAAAVAFFAALTAKTGDLGAGKEVALFLDGREAWRGTLTRETALAGEAAVEIPADALRPGAKVEVRLACPRGSASASISVRYHETGPAIRAASHGFTVVRRFFALRPEEREGKRVWVRTPVTETLPAGTQVECEVEVTTPREREYVMVASPHAAGFEPAREVGMEVVGREAAVEARVEGHDDRTLFFAARLPAGRALFRHVLRATHVGAFTALPAQAEIMYFPDVRGNSDGEVWEITPAGPAGADREGEDR